MAKEQRTALRKQVRRACVGVRGWGFEGLVWGGGRVVVCPRRSGVLGWLAGVWGIVSVSMFAFVLVSSSMPVLVQDPIAGPIPIPATFWFCGRWPVLDPDPFRLLRKGTFRFQCRGRSRSRFQARFICSCMLRAAGYAAITHTCNTHVADPPSAALLHKAGGLRKRG